VRTTTNSTLSTTGSFVVPGWGGVVVWNPPSCGADGTSAAAVPLNMTALKPLLGVMAAQVRTLRILQSTAEAEELK
jgi:hypothetical protein